MRVLVGGTRDGSQPGIRGSLSCLQLFSTALTAQQFHFQKDCHLATEEEKIGRCPQDYHFYDGMCYMVLQMHVPENSRLL